MSGRAGGLAVKVKEPPRNCPRCGRYMVRRRGKNPWMAYLGHLGLHGYADRNFGGDIYAAQKALRDKGRLNGMAPPWNQEEVWYG